MTSLDLGKQKALVSEGFRKRSVYDLFLSQDGVEKVFLDRPASDAFSATALHNNRRETAVKNTSFPYFPEIMSNQQLTPIITMI